MGVLKIACHSSQEQMDKMVKLISENIYQSRLNDIHDIDSMVGELRICVDFDIYLDRLEIKSAEVLDRHWEVLYEDSAVLFAWLKPIVKEYNRLYTEGTKQGKEIREDEK